MPTIDQEVLTQAVALANAFGFGFLQVWLKSVPGKHKPLIYSVVTTFATVVAYHALVSDNLYIQMIITGITSAVGVTGGYNYVDTKLINKLAPAPKEAKPV